MNVLIRLIRFPFLPNETGCLDFLRTRDSVLSESLPPFSDLGNLKVRCDFEGPSCSCSSSSLLK